MKLQVSSNQRENTQAPSSNLIIQFCQPNLKNVFYQKLRSAEECGNGFEMIFVFTTIPSILFELLCRGAIAYLNELITTVE
jgi:hypothetical protein